VRVWHERVSEQTETLRVPADGLASGTLALDARGFVRAPYCRTLVGVQHRDDILDQTFEAAEPLEASWGFITNEDFTLVAHSDEPSAFGELLVEVPLISSALRGQVSSRLGGSGDSLLVHATAVPITAPGGMPFGVLVATRVHERLAAAIALVTNTGVVPCCA